MSKYQRWYNSIIFNAKNRILEGYKETHHIIPRCVGGSDRNDNLVDLTAREHFICHWLLTKIYIHEHRDKMIYALNGMKRNSRSNDRYSTYITSKVYERLKTQFSKVHSQNMKGRPAHNKGKPVSEETKIKIKLTKKLYPYKMTKETLSKRSKMNKGKKRTEETKLKISLSLKGHKKGPMSQEEKLKRSNALTGTKKPEGHSQKVSNAVKGNISINKNGIEKKIKQDFLQDYLNDGWLLGGRQRKVIK